MLSEIAASLLLHVDVAHTNPLCRACLQVGMVRVVLCLEDLGPPAPPTATSVPRSSPRTSPAAGHTNARQASSPESISVGGGMSQDARSSGVGGRGRNEPGGDSAGSDSSQRNEAVALSAAAVGHNGTNLMASPEYLAAYELEVWKRGERLGNRLWSLLQQVKRTRVLNSRQSPALSQSKTASCFWVRLSFKLL